VRKVSTSCHIVNRELRRLSQLCVMHHGRERLTLATFVGERSEGARQYSCKEVGFAKQVLRFKYIYNLKR
jgi:hypothetical protein